MADLERVYNVPLRKEFGKVPCYKRAKKAVTALRQFISKNMKSDDVKISASLNKKVWSHGIKHPPHHVKITVRRDDKGVVFADLFGAAAEAEKKTKRAAKKKEDKKAKAKKTEKKTESKEKKPAEKTRAIILTE